MAHNIKIVPVPHKNKDGTLSEHRHDYEVIDRHRGKKVLVGVASNPKAAETLMQQHRNRVVADHLEKHPNDGAFKSKHAVEEIDKKENVDV